MIDYEQFCRIQACRREGLKAGQIATKLGLDARTVAAWLQKKRFQPKQSANRASKLDPYKRDIVSMVERYPYSAVQIYQKIREQGFDGGYTIVKDYVRAIRPKRHKPYLKLRFAPGECAQVDRHDGTQTPHPHSFGPSDSGAVQLGRSPPGTTTLHRSSQPPGSSPVSVPGDGK
jgi:transposase